MDPIADLLISIKNGYMAKRKDVSAPYSKFKFAVAKVLESENFVGKVEEADRSINIELIYENGKPKISQVKKVSKLGLRVYAKSKNIKTIRGGRGMTIVSTSKGLMSGKQARSQKLGGEVICQIW
ncbi:MAG TPA: 30S ribosomal protein S8 [Candidatus Saccharimonadales bacterium]|nr:30S ribosomal protein S8 [Candidatus Saccharimonadales bacterium]